MHFSAGDNRLQSSIHGRRALAFNELGELQECENEIKKCTMCDPQTALVRFTAKINGIMILFENPIVSFLRVTFSHSSIIFNLYGYLKFI